MIRYLIFRILFIHTFVHTFQCTSSEFIFFNFRFSSRKSQSQQTSKKNDSFYNTVTIHISFYKPQLIQHWKQYAPATQPKTFVTIQIFWQTYFCLASEKTFALHHFWKLKNCFLEALWKRMSVYFCISPWENVCYRDVVRFYVLGSAEAE